VTQSAAPKKLYRQLLSPAHTQDSGQRSRHHPQTKDEARHKNDRRPVALQSAARREGRRLSETRNHYLVAHPEAVCAAIIPNGESDVVPECRRDDTRDNDERKAKLMFGIGKKAGQQQDGLAWDGNASVFQKQCQSHREIAVGQPYGL